VLSQTGLVGGLLFGGFLGCALAAVWLARSRRSPLGHAVAAAAVVTFAYWALHGSIDWFWEFPGLAGPAFAWLGLAGGLERPAPAAVSSANSENRISMPAAAGYTLALVASVVSLGLPWLAAREIERAADTWRSDPEDAYSILDRARALNPLSARPDLVAGAIAMRQEDFGRAEDSFERALERKGDDWYAELELAIVAAREGRQEEALTRLDRAEELNPLEEAVGLVREGVRSGEPVDPHVIDRIFLQRVEERSS
jgi:tetratricopeptide (TPR) repeat protein